MFSNDKNGTVTLDASSPSTAVNHAQPSGALALVLTVLTVPSAIHAFTPGENAAYEKAGLPPIFCYALQKPKKVTSVCGLLGLPDHLGSGSVSTP